MECLEDYKTKKENMIRCQEENKKAKNSYEKILERTIKIYEAILEEDVNLANDFINSDNKERKKDLTNILTENGINEKNQFDPDVISNSVNISFDIYKKEIEIFFNAYNRTKKVLEEIQENDVKLDKHKKFINDSNSKLHFLNAEKDYVIGFLDNERIAAIYDKKIHRKLMLEACKNFETDLVHINSLYDILLKETISRASKRLYKENYNKSYLADIEKTSENIGEEVNKLKANSLAVMNLNYWRIEGISKIQEVFEKDVKEIYGRDLDDIFPKEEIEDKPQEITESQEASEENIVSFTEPLESTQNQEEIPETTLDEKINSLNDDNFIKNPNYKFLKSSKENFEKAVSKLEDKTEKIEETSDDESSDLGGLFEKISMLDDLDDEKDLNKEVSKDIEEEKNNLLKDEDIEEKVEIEDEEQNGEDSYKLDDDNDDDDEEESIFDFYFKQPDLDERKRRMRDEKKLNADSEKKNIFKKLIGFNSKKQKEA